MAPFSPNIDDEVKDPVYAEPEMPIYKQPSAIAKDNIAYAFTGTERNINTITTSPNDAYGAVGNEMQHMFTGNCPSPVVETIH